MYQTYTQRFRYDWIHWSGLCNLVSLLMIFMFVPVLNKTFSVSRSILKMQKDIYKEVFL